MAAKRFRWALEMLGRRCKNRHFHRFWPKPWTPTRRPENGPAASFDDQPNGRVSDTRPDSDFRGFGPRPDGLGSRLRESLRVFLASFGGPARSDQGVSEAVSDLRWRFSSRFEGVPERFSCLFSGTCRIRSGSQRGLSRRPRFSFEGVLDDLPCFFWLSCEVRSGSQ